MSLQVNRNSSLFKLSTTNSCIRQQRDRVTTFGIVEGGVNGIIGIIPNLCHVCGLGCNFVLSFISQPNRLVALLGGQGVNAVLRLVSRLGFDLLRGSGFFRRFVCRFVRQRGSAHGHCHGGGQCEGNDLFKMGLFSHRSLSFLLIKFNDT